MFTPQLILGKNNFLKEKKANKQIKGPTTGYLVFMWCLAGLYKIGYAAILDWQVKNIGINYEIQIILVK